MKDSNGKSISKSIRRESDGAWGANVWFASNGWASTVRRYSYSSRDAARASDISDEVGKRGRVR